MLSISETQNSGIFWLAQATCIFASCAISKLGYGGEAFNKPSMRTAEFRSPNRTESPRHATAGLWKKVADVVARTARAAGCTLKLAGPLATLSACANNGSDVPEPPRSSIGKNAHVDAKHQGLALNALNPPPPPIILPFASGVSVPVSQRGLDTPTHCNRQILRAMGVPAAQVAECRWENSTSTLHAIDWNTGGSAIAPVSGTVRLSEGNCVVRDVECNGGWGNTVELAGLDGRRFLFAHCNSFNPGIADNDFVLQGEALCEIGATGNAGGVHLHFDQVGGQGGRGSIRRTARRASALSSIPRSLRQATAASRTAIRPTIACSCSGWWWEMRGGVC